MRPNDVGHKSEGPPKNKRISHEGFYPALGRADTGKRTFLFLCITNSAGNWACNPDAQPKTSRAAKKWTTHTHTHTFTRENIKKMHTGRRRHTLSLRTPKRKQTNHKKTTSLATRYIHLDDCSFFGASSPLVPVSFRPPSTRSWLKPAGAGTGIGDGPRQINWPSLRRLLPRSR